MFISSCLETSVTMIQYTPLFISTRMNTCEWTTFLLVHTDGASPDGSAVWGVVVSTRWWLLVDHCVLRNWGRILVRAVKGFISWAGMVSICPLLWQRDVKLKQTIYIQMASNAPIILMLYLIDISILIYRPYHFNHTEKSPPCVCLHQSIKLFSYLPNQHNYTAYR